MQFWGLGKVFKSPGEGYLDFVHKLLSDEGRGGVKNCVIMTLYPTGADPPWRYLGVRTPLSLSLSCSAHQELQN